MGEQKSYLILGRGRWAQRMQTILAGENRKVFLFGDCRPASNESPAAYIERMASRFVANAGQIAWLCVPPGPHVVQMLRAALLAGVHCVVEKPWFGSETETTELVQSAEERNVRFAVHYEYCLLQEVQRWQRDLRMGPGLTFSGRFLLSRPNHWKMSALDNLGSHLLSIREFAVTHASVAEIRCGYDQPDVRQVQVTQGDKQVARIDLLDNKEPIIQRFISGFENAISSGAAWPFNLQFASRVANAVDMIRAREEKASSEPSSS